MMPCRSPDSAFASIGGGYEDSTFVPAGRWSIMGLLLPVAEIIVLLIGLVFDEIGRTELRSD